jgi:tetratricopeptide (TPR) repeat protein
MEGLEEAYSLSAKRQVSLQNLQRQRELVMARLDSGEPATIGMLAGLADVHLEQNLFHEAVPMFESTLKAIEEARVDDGAHLDVKTLKELDIIKRNTLVALSTAHQSLGNYAAAIRYLEQRAEGERGPGIRLDALFRIAWLHSKNGDCQQSLTTYLQLLSEQLELGPEQVIPANKTRRLVGTLHKQLGDANEALSWYQTALEGFESLSGGRNGKDKAVSAAATAEAAMDSSSQAVVEALVTTNLMSTLYSALGQLDTALEYRLRAAEGFERELGADADLTLGAALALAKMYKVRERKVEADFWFLMALRGYEAKLGDGVDGGDGGGGEVSTIREQIVQLKREMRDR